MVQKRFSIALDIKRSSSNRPIEVVEGDNTNLLEIALTDDGAPVDLTGCRVAAVFSAGGRTVQQDNGGNGILMDPAENNRFTIELFPSSFAPGLVECEVLVLSGEGHSAQATSAKFNFSCRRSILNADTILAAEEYPLLVGLIRRVVQTEESLAGMQIEETARAADESGRKASEAARALAELAREGQKAKLQNLSATAVTLPAGSAATAALTEGAAAFELTLGIPKGDTGDVTHHRWQHAAGGTDALAPADIGAAPAAILRTATLSAASWAGSSAPYTQTVSVSGITASSVASAGLSMGATGAQAQAARAAALLATAQGAGAITFSAFGDKPTVDLPVGVVILG